MLTQTRYITPDCLRALYDIDYEPIATDQNSYGIVEYEYKRNFALMC